MPNKKIRFILNLKRRDSIRNKELSKSVFLSVTDRVKQLKMNHVFKIKNYKCPPYMLSHFSRLDEDITRMKTRASPTDFFLPKVCGQGITTLFLFAIKES